jgi:hypothetical protein
MSERLSDLQKMRALLTASALWSAINETKQRTDVLGWIKMGLFELMDLADALDRGGEHPLLDLWQERKSATSRPAPSLREQHARRLAVLLPIALQRTGLSKSKARKTAAKPLAKTGLFVGGPTVDALRHWEERMAPPLTPDDEKVIAGAMASCGNDRQRLVDYFIGLVRLSRDPFIPARLP